MKEGLCLQCGKKGHIARQCNLGRGNNQNSQNNQNHQNNRNNNQQQQEKSNNWKPRQNASTNQANATHPNETNPTARWSQNISTNLSTNISANMEAEPMEIDSDSEYFATPATSATPKTSESEAESPPPTPTEDPIHRPTPGERRFISNYPLSRGTMYLYYCRNKMGRLWERFLDGNQRRIRHIPKMGEPLKPKPITLYHHATKSWLSCYDDYCNTHRTEKEG